MISIVWKKEGGAVNVINADMELIKAIKAINNKCADCSNCYADKCPKVAYDKKDIRDYDFITDGYQVINGELENLAVIKCANFTQDQERRPRTKEEIIGQSELRKGLSMSYFGTDTYREAEEMRWFGFKNGTLTEYDPRKSL